MVYKWIKKLQPRLPGSCLLCGAACTGQRSEPDLCTACQAHLPPTGPCCPSCGQPQATQDTCGTCQRQPPPFEAVVAPWLYAPPLDHLILRLKTPAAPAPARSMSLLLARYLATRARDKPTLLIPVPLHAKRLRERGFNQAALLTRQLAATLQLPWRADLLSKPRESADQRGLDKRQRRRNLRGCFDCRPLPSHCHVALIDDVVTTGATAWAATEALRKAGAERVEIWALARTP